jgi:hypothetical protein
VPSDFGSALQGFTKLLGAPGEDGVFRYQPSPIDTDLPKPEDDSAEVAEWFSTATDPEIVQAVAKAEADARFLPAGEIAAQAIAQPVFAPPPPPPARHGSVDL